MPDPIQIDEIIHSTRRTIALIIQPDGTLTVRAPLRMPESRIHEFVETHANWIHRKREQVQASPSSQKKDYHDGELFLFLGKEYPLQIVAHTRTRLILKEDSFHISKAHLPEAREAFIRWYKLQAREVIAKRVALHGQQNGLYWKRLRISSARTRWGSCTAGGNLSFTWRLVLAPLEVIDYVVVHELVHTRIQNHSLTFWKKVAEIMPDYKKHIAWLKINGRFLSLDGS
jgi:hypothetical protein